MEKFREELHLVKQYSQFDEELDMLKEVKNSISSIDEIEEEGVKISFNWASWGDRRGQLCYLRGVGDHYE